MWNAPRIRKAMAIIACSLVSSFWIGFYALLIPLCAGGYVLFDRYCKVQHIDRLLRQYDDLFHRLMQYTSSEKKAENMAKMVALLQDKTPEQKICILDTHIRLLQEASWFSTTKIQNAAANAAIALGRTIDPDFAVMFEAMPPPMRAALTQAYQQRLNKGLEAVAAAATVPELQPQLEAIRAAQSRMHT